MWIQRCQGCGWIDGSDLARQVDEAVMTGRAELTAQIERLAAAILTIPGEPRSSGGAVEVAIRLLEELNGLRTELAAARSELNERLRRRLRADGVSEADLPGADAVDAPLGGSAVSDYPADQSRHNLPPDLMAALRDSPTGARRRRLEALEWNGEVS
jgi:hypothetical protein